MAGRVDQLYFFLLGVSVFFAGLICILIIVFAIKYRRRSDDEQPRPITGNLGLEIFWTLVPLGLTMVIFVWGARLFFVTYYPPKDALEINVVAKQWMWKVQHPGGQREIDELHIPVGRPVELIMISQDVIHSFYVPAFRTKQDVLPGRYTREWFTPTKVGRYHLFCAEYCGTNHSAMTGWVDVMQPADYAAWLAARPQAESMVAEGQHLFTSLGCSGCHSEQSRVPAPLLVGLAGHPVGLSDGSTMIADDTYLRDSILLPNKQIVGGFQPVMPTFQRQLSEEQVMELVAYIKSLGDRNETPAAP